MNVRTAITPLTKRVIAFMALFVVISGIIGPRIIASDIFESAGFEIYGSLGKAVIFALITFILLARHKKRMLELQQWQPVLLAWLAPALAAFMVAWGNVGYLITGGYETINLFLAHAGLWVCLVFVVITCFGIANISLIWQAYRREIIFSSLIAVAFYVFLLGVYALWQPLASVVMVCVAWLLEVSGLITAVIPPNMLVLDKFGITVAEYCSGVESIALFTSLYVIVGLLERHRLNKKRYFIVFPVALLFLFTFNILRVYGLIMAGYYINQEIAFSLFHTYAGMIFFIIYSAIFWAVMYNYLVPHAQKKMKQEKV